MEERRKLFHAFLTLNQHNGSRTSQPCVHMSFDPNNLRSPLIVLTLDDFLHECSAGRFDRDAELVRWLLHQLTTYDCERQRILAVAFDRTTILSEVLWCP